MRVDINSEGRADMRTVGWENWQPLVGDMNQSFGTVTVTLRAGENGGIIRLSGKKAIVVHGVTLGADGAVATGGKPAAMEVKLEGLVSGPHTFVGYHHAVASARVGRDMHPGRVSAVRGATGETSVAAMSLRLNLWLLKSAPICSLWMKHLTDWRQRIRKRMPVLLSLHLSVENS